MNQKLLIGLAALLLLAALGGGAYYFVRQQGSGDRGQESATTSDEEITSIVDMDDMLGHNIEDLREILGEPVRVEGAFTIIGGTKALSFKWEMDGFILFVSQMSPDGPIVAVKEEISILQNKQLLQQKELFSLVGVNVDFETYAAGKARTELWYFVGEYGFVAVEEDENVVSVTVVNRDVVQKEVFAMWRILLREYFDKIGVYPSTGNNLVLWNDTTFNLTPLSGILSEDDPIDVRITPPGKEYGYRSDGSTYYELTAALDDSNDPECVIENGLCIFRIRNGEVVSKK